MTDWPMIELGTAAEIREGFINLIPRHGLESRYLAWCLHFQAYGRAHPGEEAVGERGGRRGAVTAKARGPHLYIFNSTQHNGATEVKPMHSKAICRNPDILGGTPVFH